MRHTDVLIETYWNVNFSFWKLLTDAVRVLIETYWNVNVSAAAAVTIAPGINRNILECKVRRRFKNFCTSSGINRNILECKDISENRKIIIQTSINRNILECKGMKQGRLLGNMCIHTTLNVVIPHSIIRHRHPAIIQSCYWMITQPKGDFLPYPVTYISSL